MSLKLKIGLLVGIFLIAAFAFAENGGLLPAPSASVAAGQPATATALPEPPAAQPQAQPTPRKNPLGITYGFDERVGATLITMPAVTTTRKMRITLILKIVLCGSGPAHSSA